LRIMEQETCLNFHAHDDDDDITVTNIDREHDGFIWTVKEESKHET